MRRRDLPPPPPALISPWPDATAARAERGRILGELVRHSLGLWTLLALWTVAGVCALGWSFVGMALMSFERGGGENLLGLLFLVLGTGVLVPGGLLLAAGARRDRRVRLLLGAWAASGHDPVTDPGHRAAGRSLGWLLASFGVCALGLWVTFGVAMGAAPGGAGSGRVAYCMGLGLILWITGLLGVAKAAVHYRWAVRAFARPGARSAGAAAGFGGAAPAGPGTAPAAGGPSGTAPAGPTGTAPAGPDPVTGGTVPERRSAPSEPPPRG
ncbi:hypothetical protein [Streptomyces sp. NPDC101132]|uniref:hypothetical protein n=1 Tax=Streptomyces sp. NPDC101132 TaxID=3366110 RepID=UPI0038054ED5